MIFFKMCSLLKKIFGSNVFNLIHQKQSISYTSRLLSSIVPLNEIRVPTKLSGRAASNEQKRLINDYIIDPSLSKPDWNSLQKSVLLINRGYLNDKNINGCILEMCGKHKRLDLAKSFMKYVKSNSHTKFNIGLELLYMRVCYASQNQLTDNDINEIQTSCQLILKNYTHLINSVLLEGLVMGICCTPLWHNSLEYMNILKNEYAISSNTYLSIILKAFNEGEADLGWTLTQTIFEKYGVLPLEIFVTWFNLSQKNYSFNFEKVLEFLRDNECIIKEDLANVIRENLNKNGIKTSNSIINHYNGVCKNCNQTLKTVEITEEEFKKLQDCFLSNVMIGKNIFNNSSPQELENFKNFLEITGPYDVVVDGLNLAYASFGKMPSHSLIKIVMKIFIDKKKKILLIGRQHLIKMLDKEFDFVKKHAQLFLTNDLSKDDPFVLYAALYSGFGTKILTRDLMRGHKFLLKNTKIKIVFQKWLQKHRLILQTHIGNKVTVKEPITYLQATQESGKGIWHLPYQEFKESGAWSKPNTSPDNWICINS